MHSHHGHAHAHGGDSHGRRAASRRRLSAALGLAALYMVAEAVGGWWTGSLALLADAGHMLSDVASLALAVAALWVADRPATARRTYGHARAEILAALVQGAALVAVAAIVSLEAVERFTSPSEVIGPGMLAIATGGLVVNGIGLWLLSGGTQDSMSVRGAWLHVASDALGSIAAIAAGAAIWWRGWTWADPAASLAICALILAGAWRLLRDAVDVLMEAAPRHLDVDEIRRELCDLEDVAAVHDLHVWTIGSGEISLSCHLVEEPDAPPGSVLETARKLLLDRFEIAHTTVQVEPARPGEDDGGAACEPHHP